MTLLQAVVLGVIQGATEFLPISSSGHLVLVPWLLGWQIDASTLFPYSVVLHWGTLLALIAAFWSDLLRLATAVVQGIRAGCATGSPDARLAWLLILASVPAAVAGLLFGEVIRGAFSRPELVAALLLLNAGLLLAGEGFRTRRLSGGTLAELRAPDAVVVGLFQVLALFPGISRSGSTIVGGLSRGYGRLEAARFALLLAVPIMFGAGFIALSDLRSIPSDAVLEFAAGFAAALVVGVASIRWLLRFLRHGSLRGFAAYCAGAGLLCLALVLYRA